MEVGLVSLQALGDAGMRVCRGLACWAVWVQMCPGCLCDAVSLKQILRGDWGGGE